MKFRKKPMVIEARQLTKDSLRSIMLWIDGDGGKVGEWCWDEDDDQFIVERYLTIETFEGNMKAQEKDWVIKGLSGEFYPCKPDIFEMTYESVDGLELPEKFQTHVHAVNTSSERVNKMAKSEHEFECPRCGHCCRGWVGLTDEEIYAIEGVEMKYDGTGEYYLEGEYEFAKAIEATLKDKNT